MGKELKKLYIQRAAEYEYSWAPEYKKRTMTKRASSKGTVDIDPADVERVEVSPDGAWVPAKVWVPKEWLK